MSVANYGKTRCSKAAFGEALLESGGNGRTVERRWSWLMTDRAKRGLRDEADFLSWNHLLLVVEGEPSVELSRAGLWQPLAAAINKITALPAE